MELRHLRYFVTVAETLHFGQAAKQLAIAQPPLSQQIKALEEEIGVVLLARTKRQVALTAAGKLFLAEAKKTLAQAEQAVLVAQRADRGEIGQLRVGFVSSAAYGQLPSILRLMRQRHPEVSLSLRDLTSREQVQAIKEGRLDVGLVRPPLPGADTLAMRSIWQEPLIAALPETSPLAGQTEIALETLAGQPFIQIPRRVAPGYYDLFIRSCAAAGFTPGIVQEARTTPTIVNLIAGGLGVALLPASLKSLQRTGVIYRPLSRPVPTIDMAVIRRPDDRSPVLEAFLGILREMEDSGSSLSVGISS